MKRYLEVNSNKILENLYLFIIGFITFYYCLGSIAEIFTEELFESAQLMEVDKRFITDNGKTIEFRNLEEVKWNEQYNIFLKWYPSFQKLGDTLSYILSLISFGVLGALVKILAYQYNFKKGLEKRKIYLGPVLGGLLGFMILVLADFLPEFRLESGDKKFYFTFAFIAGMFSEKFFEWLRKKVDDFLKIETNQ
ncbi:hypothetical protein [Arenibacter latericius]|uniref:hypothetical protein n=1 Tax=Arenibacter latericius TaxID=86104 RepID=UPI00041C11B4|nr:hypothetical protein [Arenibacter latericius]